MELLELKEKIIEIFQTDVDHLGDALMDAVEKERTDLYDAFVEVVDGDLTTDWLQMVFQYYLADRKEKMQDYTPQCLAEFMGLLAGETEEMIDLCAGSGALTIQKWNQNPDLHFIMYEIDANVIPYLLFNCVIRNISGEVLHSDALQDEIYASWTITKGERYGRVACIKSTI